MKHLPQNTTASGVYPLPWFVATAPLFVKNIAEQCGTLISVSKGKYLYETCEQAKGIWFVHSGMFMFELTGWGTPTQAMGIAYPGTCFGEMPVLYQIYPPGCIKSLMRSSVYFVERETFASHPLLNMLELSKYTLLKSYTFLYSNTFFSRLSAKKKISIFLCMYILNNNHLEFLEEYIKTDFPITKKYCSELVCLDRSTLFKSFTELEKNRFVLIKGKYIFISKYFFKQNIDLIPKQYTLNIDKIDI